jgi:ABC-2 type transport system ATP-binding protein
MDDIEALCSRVLLIGHGRILSDGSLEALRAQVTTERRLIVDLMEEGEEVHDSQAETIAREGARVTLRFDPDQVTAAELIGRLTARHAIRDLFVEHPPIEEVIARLYGSHSTAPRDPSLPLAAAEEGEIWR